MLTQQPIPVESFSHTDGHRHRGHFTIGLHALVMSYRPTPDLHDTDTAIKQELLLNTTIIVTSQKSQFAQINI